MACAPVIGHSSRVLHPFEPKREAEGIKEDLHVSAAEPAAASQKLRSDPTLQSNFIHLIVMNQFEDAYRMAKLMPHKEQREAALETFCVNLSRAATEGKRSINEAVSDIRGVAENDISDPNVRDRIFRTAAELLARYDFNAALAMRRDRISSTEQKNLATVKFSEILAESGSEERVLEFVENSGLNATQKDRCFGKSAGVFARNGEVEKGLFIAGKVSDLDERDNVLWKIRVEFLCKNPPVHKREKEKPLIWVKEPEGNPLILQCRDFIQEAQKTGDLGQIDRALDMIEIYNCCDDIAILRSACGALIQHAEVQGIFDRIDRILDMARDFLDGYDKDEILRFTCIILQKNLEQVEILARLDQVLEMANVPNMGGIPKGIQKLELSQGSGADFCVWSEGHCQRQGPKRRPNGGRGSASPEMERRRFVWRNAGFSLPCELQLAKVCCQADAGVSQFLIHEGYKDHIFKLACEILSFHNEMDRIFGIVKGCVVSNIVKTQILTEHVLKIKRPEQIDQFCKIANTLSPNEKNLVLSELGGHLIDRGDVDGLLTVATYVFPPERRRILLESAKVAFDPLTLQRLERALKKHNVD